MLLICSLNLYFWKILKWNLYLYVSKKPDQCEHSKHSKYLNWVEHICQTSQLSVNTFAKHFNSMWTQRTQQTSQLSVNTFSVFLIVKSRPKERKWFPRIWDVSLFEPRKNPLSRFPLLLLRSLSLFSRVLRDTTPRFVCRSVGWLVGQSVPILFFLCFCGLWPHCTCQSALVTQILPLPTRTRLR